MKLSFRKDGDAWLDMKKKKKKNLSKGGCITLLKSTLFSLPTHFLFGSLYLLMWLIESRRFKGTLTQDNQNKIEITKKIKDMT